MLLLCGYMCVTAENTPQCLGFPRTRNSHAAASQRFKERLTVATETWLLFTMLISHLAPCLLDLAFI